MIDQAVIAHLAAHLPQRKLRPVTHWCLQARCLAWFLWVNDEGAGEVSPIGGGLSRSEEWIKWLKGRLWVRA